MKENRENFGLMLGFIGVFCFGLTLPMTRFTVEYFSTVFVGLGRTVVAGIIAGIVLFVRREKLPTMKQFKGIIYVALGAALGFPLLASWAMENLPASHGAVVLALLPLTTAGFATLRVNERPSRIFWIASFISCFTVLLYAVYLGFNQLQLSDLALLVAVILLGFSYAEGGRLSKELGGWQVIAWAVVISTPFLFLPVIASLSSNMLHAPVQAWLGFIYLAVVSQLLAFIAWYNGLAIGGIAKVSQVQYIQPFLIVIFSAILLNESITFMTIVASAIVVIAVIIGKNAPVKKLSKELH